MLNVRITESAKIQMLFVQKQVALLTAGIVKMDTITTRGNAKVTK